MRLTIPQLQLLKTLQAVERAVNERSTLPILSNILLETTEQELILTATDLDVGIRCRFPLTHPIERGAVALPARKLTAIVRELPDDSVTVEAKKNHTAILNCGTSSFRIPGLPPEDFPILPEAPSAEGNVLPQHALKALILRTAHAMSTEETRFLLNGALLSAQQREVLMVATDGRRLAVATAPLTRPAPQPFKAIIPAKTVRELGRLLDANEADDVTISHLPDHQLAFRFGQVAVMTRLIEGEFPRYDAVIPAPSAQQVTCELPLLVNAIRRANLMTSASSQAVMFELEATRLVISKESAELGSAREELPVSYDGPPMTMAFNPEFWLEALRTMDASAVTIEVNGPDRPAVIRQPDWTYLVLPMKVG
jgi:DNA polymerase-3 subunit beta